MIYITNTITPRMLPKRPYSCDGRPISLIEAQDLVQPTDEGEPRQWYARVSTPLCATLSDYLGVDVQPSKVKISAREGDQIILAHCSGPVDQPTSQWMFHLFDIVEVDPADGVLDHG